MGLPLEGLLVVSIDQAVAAPFCASRLAQMGARVIKVERPGGDFARGYDKAAGGESAYFVWLNHGKESIELDIKDAQDAALLHRMIARADVFIQNLAPGAAARAGFGSKELRDRHPGLITCDISGYGEDGPYRDMKAYDMLIQAETGLTAITGGPEAPGRVGVSVVDIAAGLYAINAILTALYDRERTGLGTGLKVSLFDSLADWMTVPLIHQEHGGGAPARVGINHPSIAPYGRYACADGEIVISIQNEREWVRLCEGVLGDAGIATDRRFSSNTLRVENRPALDEAINAVFGSLTMDQLTARLDRASIAYGRLNTIADLAAHPQLRRWSVPTPAGPFDLPAPPAVAEFEPVAGPVPEAGADTKRLREEFAE